MSEHLSTDLLQTFAEGLLPDPDRTVVDSHLAACLRCRTEAEEWQSLFLTLSSLPQFDPSTGFVDRVMTGYRAQHATAVAPWYSRAARSASRFLPRTTRGWALAAAFLAMPVVSVSAVLAWLLSHPFVTPGTLWAFTSDRVAEGMHSVTAAAIGWVLNTSTVSWIVRMSDRLVHQVGMSGVGALAATIAITITLSIWVLYNNLFRTPSREANHVFSF